MGLGARTLTPEQIQEVLQMREDDYTLREIAKKMYVSVSLVAQIVPSDGKRRRPRDKKHRYVYPNIEKWLNDNRYTVMEFSKEVGVHSGTMSSHLLGRSYPTKPVIDSILKVTGMSYEEAFEEQYNDG